MRLKLIQIKNHYRFINFILNKSKKKSCNFMMLLSLLMAHFYQILIKKRFYLVIHETGLF